MNLLSIDHAALGEVPAADVWVGGRRVLRLTRARAGLVYGPVTVLRAHRGGLSVRRAEVDRLPTMERLVKKAVLICGLLVCSRWGSAMVQWRGFPQVGI